MFYKVVDYNIYYFVFLKSCMDVVDNMRHGRFV